MPVERQRDGDTGRFVKETTAADALAVVQSAEPIVTATDVADALDIGNDAARTRLKALHDAGEIERRDVGAAATVWWPADTDADGEQEQEQGQPQDGERT